jgi:hypothetical protein
MKLKYIAFGGAAFPGLLMAAVSYGQSRPTPPIVLNRGVQAPQVTSPEILPDGRLTFRSQMAIASRR